MENQLQETNFIKIRAEGSEDSTIESQKDWKWHFNVLILKI
jgi:hypothetical protein